MSLNLKIDKIREYFEYDAHRFANNRWFGSRVARYDYLITKEIFLKSLNLKSQDQVLEIGCGPGVWTEILAERVDKIRAIDISSNMIKEARSRVQRGNVLFEISGFLHYKNNQRYDKIVSIRTIEYMQDKTSVIRKIYNLLKPGGKAVIITKTPLSFFTFRSQLGNLFRNIFMVVKKKQKIKPEIVMFKINPQELKNIFNACGFNRIKVSLVILRLPWFFRGSYYLPFEEILFKFCNTIVRKSFKFPAFLNRILYFFSESYLIQAEK